MEPWLDSLSEDWKSEHNSSSLSLPRPTSALSKHRSIAFNVSQSRLPHPAQNHSTSSTKGKYLRSRSLRQTPPLKGSPVLVEQNSSRFNISANISIVGTSASQKQTLPRTLPRRPSSAVSDSAQSVQHHTLHNTSKRVFGEDDMPEWKRRLAQGEDIAGEGCDLFGPSRLEGIFMAPPKVKNAHQPTTYSFEQPKPWPTSSASSATCTLNQYQSVKASRSKLPGLDIVEEVNEEAEATSTGSPLGDAAKSKGSQHAVVKPKGSSLERLNNLSLQARSLDLAIISLSDVANLNRLQQDPRTRTTSGREELKNERISPITLSTQSTIRDHALRDSLNKSTTFLQVKLDQLRLDDSLRPLSCSSDQYFIYEKDKATSDGFMDNGTDADLTSQSLPDDLSMGTHEFISRGGFINTRRGGFANEGSFHGKTLSESKASSNRSTSGVQTGSVASSSPLLSVAGSRISHEAHLRNVSSTLTSPNAGQAPHDRHQSMGSPLKLFGNRDTYTNNKLLRVLSQFEHADSRGDDDPRDLEHANSGTECELLMSQFGQGDLDQYDFVQEVKVQHLGVIQGNALDNHSFAGEIRSDPLDEQQPSALRCLPTAQPVIAPNQGNFVDEHPDTDLEKRCPAAPLEERTPKRRRTLPQQEIELLIPPQLGDDHVFRHSRSSKLAGTKRKDARYDDFTPMIDPESLAGRQMLRPRTIHQRPSNAAPESGVCSPPMDFDVYAARKLGSVEFRDAVAEELVQVVNDVRKTSVTTQDYMEEATKIMQMIRAKSKPKNSLHSVEEPAEGSQVSPKVTHSLDIEEISSGDEFSRPPSRNGGKDIREQQRHHHQDPRIASHLQKFKESDDLDLLIETSALEPVSIPDHVQAEEAALTPIPEDKQQSSPSNIRIRDSLDMQRKRKHSASTMEDWQHSLPNVVSTHSSSVNSTQRTIPTSSTSGSGRKGVINPGKVQIPDHVGAMTFDHATKTWVKEPTALHSSTTNRRAWQATSEEDPFEHISDLSIRGLREIARSSDTHARDVSRPSSRDSPSGTEHACSAETDSLVLETNPENVESMATSQTTARSQLIQHETRIHDGKVSLAPKSYDSISKQPRVVTIASSLPLVSTVAYQDDLSTPELETNLTTHALEGPRPQGDVANGELETHVGLKQSTAVIFQSGSNSFSQKSWSGRNYVGRPVSRIEEQDELAANDEMSLVPISKSQAMTPVPHRSEGTSFVPNTVGKASSMICLTPLSDFSMHQVERPSHEEASFVALRTHPGALRQAHGSLALGLDNMMKAITDVEPFEPYWDQIRRLDLTGKHLTSLHRLEEFCATLEELTISTNELTQLSGVPLSVRTLNVRRNHLSNITPWGHLQNLQYLDVSENELESLEGLSCLYHLRELKANDNKISDIDGILDLNGLQCLTLRGNELESLDFEGGELTRLTQLDVSHNELTHVHGLSWLPALEDLNLEQNNLSDFAIPDTHQLFSLRHLRISVNKLISIDLSVCPNIESLYLDMNQVTEVRRLSHARHLHTFSLRAQTDSPDIVGHVLSLPNDCAKIFLSSNPVPGGKLRLPSSPLFSLRYLELSSCGISSIAAGFGTKIPNCRVLNLNFNALGSISHLQGMLHLNKLLLVGNRLERLRRSCLALSRHPALTKVDLRNNPLTVGFYSPVPAESHLVVHSQSLSALPVLHDPYVLTGQIEDVDQKWLKLIDKGTRLRRRTIELLLAQKCIDLTELDGLAFDREAILQPDELWEALTNIGVLRRPRT